MVGLETVKEDTAGGGGSTGLCEHPADSSLDDVLARCASVAAALFDCETAVVLLTEGDDLVVRTAVGIDLEAIQPRRIPAGTSVSGLVAAQGGPRLFDDVSEQLGAVRENLEPYYPGPLASVPLLREGRSLGLLNLCRGPSSARFSDDDLPRMALYAEHAALLISRQTLLDRSRQDIERARAEGYTLVDRLSQCASGQARAESALSESEGMCCQLLERVNDGIAIIQDALVAYANPRILAMVGCSLEEALGLPLGAFLCEDQLEESTQAYEMMMAADAPVSNFETVLKHRDGGRVEVSVSAAPVAFRGRPAAILITRDITRRKRADEALRASRDRFHAILDSMMDGCQIIGFDWTYRYLNAAAAKHARRTKNDLLGKTMMEAYPGIEDTEMFCAIRRCMEGRSSHQMDNQLRYPDGSSAWFALSIEPMPEGVFIFSRDITDGRLSEAQLRASEARTRAIQKQVEFILGATRTCLDIIDGDFNIRYVDPYWARTYGDWKGRKCFDYFMGRESPCPDCGIVQALRTKKIAVTEELLPREGNRPIQVTSIPFQDEQGDWLVAEVNADISVRKRAEESLRESEEYHRTLFDCSRDAMMTAAPPSWRFTSCNPAALRLFGARDQAEFTSIGPADVSPELQPGGRPSAEMAVEMLESAMRDGSRFFEWTHKDLNGGTFPATVLLTRVDLGDRRFVLATVRDNSAEKRAEDALRASEARFRSITEAAQDGIVVLNPSGEISAWNPAAARIFGYNAGEALGRNAHDLLAPPRLVEVLRNVSEAFRGTGEGDAVGKTVELTGVRKTGEEFNLELSLSAVRLDDGWHSVGLVRDITERKQREEESASMHVQLLQAQRLEAIGQLAAGIAHEINTPAQYVGDNIRFVHQACASVWGLIDTYGQLAARVREGKAGPGLLADVDDTVGQAELGFLREEVPKAIEQSLEGIQRISSIVGAMKEFSHPGAAEKVPVDINRCVSATITISRNEWKYVADMVTDLDESLPHVPCLQGPFNQVMLNLIVNAAHAIASAQAGGGPPTPGGGESGDKGTITVATRRDGDCVEIRVADTGTGIPEAIRSKVFEPFFTTKPVGKGTGQGLAICRSVIVDRLGGTISFETELGRGTVFIIRLPLQPAEEPGGQT